MGFGVVCLVLTFRDVFARKKSLPSMRSAKRSGPRTNQHIFLPQSATLSCSKRLRCENPGQPYSVHDKGSLYLPAKGRVEHAKTTLVDCCGGRPIVDPFPDASATRPGWALLCACDHQRRADPMAAGMSMSAPPHWGGRSAPTSADAVGRSLNTSQAIRHEGRQGFFMTTRWGA